MPSSIGKVYLEWPDPKLGFHYASCNLHSYTWEDIESFTQTEIHRYQKVIEPTAHLILKIYLERGMKHAANFQVEFLHVFASNTDILL